MEEIKSEIESRLLYSNGLKNLNGGYANAEFDEIETDIANSENPISEKTTILLFNTECGVDDTGDGGQTWTGAIKVIIDKEYNIIDVSDW